MLRAEVERFRAAPVYQYWLDTEESLANLQAQLHRAQLEDQGIKEAPAQSRERKNGATIQ